MLPESSRTNITLGDISTEEAPEIGELASWVVPAGAPTASSSSASSDSDWVVSFLVCMANSFLNCLTIYSATTVWR